MDTEMKEIYMDVPFQTEEEATIAYNSLRIDDEPSRGAVVQKILSVDGKVLKVQISSLNGGKLRAAASSFSDLLVLVVNTLARFGPPVRTKS